MDAFTAAQNVAEDYKGGARQLGIDIDHKALSHELNETGTAKLGLKTAVKMTQRSKDLRILHAFATTCGCMVLPLPETMAVEGDDAMLLVSKLMAELNDTVQAFVGAVSDGRVCQNELAAIKRQGGELQIALQKLVTHAVAMHEQGLPPALRAVA